MNCTARHGYRQHHLLLPRELGQWACGLELTLTPVHQRIVHTLDWLNLDSLMGYAGKRSGPPERSRLALAQAFVAKAILGFEQTSQLRSRLAVNAVLVRVLRFESHRPLPSEATFSRAFSEFADRGFPAIAHEALIRQHLGATVIGHIARDSTAIHARERAQYSVAQTAALNEAKAAKAARQQKRKRASHAAAFLRSYCKHPPKRWPICPSYATRAKSAMPKATSTPGWACKTASGRGLLWCADHGRLDLGKRP